MGKRPTEKETLELILKFGISENVRGTEFEKIKLLETFAKTAKDPEIKKRTEEEIKKLRESLEFKQYETEKRITELNKDF